MEKRNALEYLYVCDLLLFPSRAEAMPRVILESMALHIPIVSTDVDGIKEMIEHEKSGLLLSLNETHLIPEYVLQLYNDDIIKNELAKNAHKVYWDKFSRKKHIEHYSDFISDLEISPNGIKI